MWNMWFNEIINGAGLGLRTSFIEEIFEYDVKPDWFEFAPENWIRKGGYLKECFEKVRENFPVACHGLSLSIGSPEPLNMDFLKELKDFLDFYEIEIYSEHISFSSVEGKNLYDLFPVPFTVKMADFISDKVCYVQDYLKRELILENISYYQVIYKELDENEFIKRILEKSGAKLLLDVNNVYVNSVNHGYDPFDYIRTFSSEEVAYIHIAGHEKLSENLIIDTHGERVTENVFELLRFALKHLGKKPVLLERDNNIPPYKELLEEYKKVREIVQSYERV